MQSVPLISQLLMDHLCSWQTVWGFSSTVGILYVLIVFLFQIKPLQNPLIGINLHFHINGIQTPDKLSLLKSVKHISNSWKLDVFKKYDLFLVTFPVSQCFLDRYYSFKE